MNPRNVFNKSEKRFIHLCLHGADIWVKAGEDYSPFAAFLQNTGQDDVEVAVHVEVG